MRLGDPLIGAAAGLAVHARERLVAGDAAGGELEHRLEEGLDRALAQERFDLVALLAGRVAAGEVVAVAERAAAARVLGRVEGGVGAGEQLGGVERVLGMAGDACRRRKRAAADLHVGDRGPGALGGLAGGGGVDAGHHEHELLAAQAPDGVAVAHHRAKPRGGEREGAVTLGVPVGVVDALEVVEVDDDHAHGASVGVRERRAQSLLAAPVVEQAGQAVGPDLLAQMVALARGVVGERGHRREALDELDLLVAERPVGARPVHVQRADHAVVRDQRDGDERLGGLVRAGHHRAQRLEQRVRHVARPAVAHGPARDAAGDRDVLGHDLGHPVADREHRLELVPAREDLVQRQVVMRHEGGEVVRDPAQRSLQRIGGEDPRRRVDECLESGLPACGGTAGRDRRNGHGD